MSKIVRFFRDESGATAIEYGLIAAGISVAIIAVVSSLGYGPEYDLHVGRDRAQVRRPDDSLTSRSTATQTARPPIHVGGRASFCGSR